MTRRRPIVLSVVDRFRPRTDRRLLTAVVEATLEHCERRDLEVSLLLTDDAGIAELHGEFLDDPTPTDVMSFLTDDVADLVVNVQRARQEARARRVSIRSEVALYVAHGLLHLCGHDDHAPRARRRMREAERAILTRLGLSPALVDEG